jgi:hypothetical protein
MQALPEHDQRVHLAARLNQYLNGVRRGRLRLPSSLRAAGRLTELSKTQIRKVAYWCKPVTHPGYRVTRGVAEYLHQVLPGRCWTATGPRPVYSHSRVGNRLPKRCKPRDARPTWPSSPDLAEIVEMSRRGISVPIQDKFPIVVKHHIARGDVKKDILLASRIVATNIVGLRSEVEVPQKFSGHFREYCGFSILVNRYGIPAGLTRFLLGQWIKCPTSLWLVEPCPFRIFLKRHVRSDFIRQTALPRDNLVVAPGGDGMASPIETCEPGDAWSIYSPRLHLLQEVSILMEISMQGCFPRRANRH